MTEQQEHVNRLVERVERHQQLLKLSDVRFVARYQRFLGSPKTWRDRLCARDWTSLGNSLAKWERRLNALVADLDGGAGIQEYFESLPIARYGEALYDKLQGQDSDRRVGWLIAPTGVGKSWTMRRLVQLDPSRTVYLHMPPRDSKRESMRALAARLAAAVGATEHTSGTDTFENVVEVVKASAPTLLVDDVQEGGVLFLKMLKHLVDDTRVKLILGTYPTAWNTLVRGTTDAMCEAQQLLGRSLQPVARQWLSGVNTADVTAYLQATVGGNGACKVLADRITPALRRHGNMRTLASALDLARANADDAGTDLDLDLVEAAVAEICPTSEDGRRQ